MIILIMRFHLTFENYKNKQMKILLTVFTILSGTLIYAQNSDSLKLAKKQAWKDSVYFNRFNKGNFHIGASPIMGWVRGDLTDINLDQYGLHTKFGYFIRSRTLLFADNTTVYTKFKHKIYPDKKLFSFYSVFSTGIRYYLKPKRFTFFGEAKISYSYNIEDAEPVAGFKPANFHHFDAAPGIGAIFSANRFDISMTIFYVYPFSYSDYITYEQIRSIGYEGIMFLPSFCFMF